MGAVSGFTLSILHTPVVISSCNAQRLTASNSLDMQKTYQTKRKQPGIIVKRILELSILVLLLGGTSFSQSLNSHHVEAGIISEVKTVQPGRPFWVAVRLETSPEWHIYWRNPGSSGYPTSIDWKLPQGFRAGPIQWPYPQRFDFEGLVIYGYEGTVYLLVRITPPTDLKPGQAIDLQADVGWLACQKVCMPGKAEVSLLLKAGNGPAQLDESSSKIFAEARSKLPIENSGWTFKAAIGNRHLRIQAVKPEWFSGAIKQMMFFPYDSSFIIQPDSAQVLGQVKDGYLLSIPLDSSKSANVSSISGVLVTDGGWRGEGSEKAVAFTAPVEKDLKVGEVTAPVTSFSFGELLLMIVFAFAGGAILNLMPCVLPVLSLKIMGFVKQAGEDGKKVLRHGMAFTIGVVVSFWILAGLLLVLRASGEFLGWGFQLQSIGFVTILSIFLFLFGLNMFGVFEIGVSLSTVGQNVSGKSSYTGSFISGVLATVVATPCTAPFMGSALGFALSQPAFVSIVVFTFLGLGMATPYLVLTTSPALLRFVPKPGVWMETLKQFMGFLLMATVLWLLWVLSQQAGAQGVLILLACLLLVGIGAWVYGRWGTVSRAKSTRRVAQIVAGLTLVAGILFAVQNISTEAAPLNSVEAQGAGIDWKPFSPELVTKLRNEHKPVFIDFTAAWCLSCQVNERVAFTSAKVQDAFKKKGIVALKADWTNQDPIIAKALAKFGRDSVPLYVYYPAGENSPVVLPELITPGIVLSALDRVR